MILAEQQQIIFPNTRYEACRPLSLRRTWPGDIPYSALNASLK
jgi:hypothetical protein